MASVGQVLSPFSASKGIARRLWTFLPELENRECIISHLGVEIVIASPMRKEAQGVSDAFNFCIPLL